MSRTESASAVATGQMDSKYRAGVEGPVRFLRIRGPISILCLVIVMPSYLNEISVN